MGHWHVIVPEATENLVLNPSAETTGNFQFIGVERSTDYSARGGYSYKLAGGTSAKWITKSLDGSADYYLTFAARSASIASLGDDVSLDNGANYSTPALIMQLDANWGLYGVLIDSSEVSGSDPLLFVWSGAIPNPIYIDMIQLEEKDHWTTYCDGDQGGCYWTGGEHESSSVRGADSRAGGVLVDLSAPGSDYDFTFKEREIIGFGGTRRNIYTTTYALLPGSEYRNTKEQPLVGTLVGTLEATSSDCDLNQARQQLTGILEYDSYPPDKNGWQPVRLWYTGADVVKEILVHYEGGLEGDWGMDNYVHEIVPIRFIAPYPYWHSVLESSTTLDVEDATVFHYAAGRFRSTGQWDDLNLVSNPGSISAVRAILPARDQLVYFAGDFTNWNGSAPLDYISAYDPDADSWSTVGSPGAVNGAIYAMAEAPNGDIYVGGAFSNLGGATGDRVAYLDASSGSWSPVSGGGAGTVYALAFSNKGSLYIGGDFTNWNADGDSDYIVRWDGAAYSAMGSGFDDMVRALVVDRTTDDLYAGGAFSQDGGAGTDFDGIARWSGGSWNALDQGFTLAGSKEVTALAIDPRGRVYITGSFTSTGAGDTARYAAFWNGSVINQLGDGMNASGSALALSDNGELLIGGQMTDAGSVTVDRLTLWRGRAYAPVDASLPGSPAISAVAVANQDPTVPGNYDIYVGFNTTGSADYGGTAAPVANGTARSFPTIDLSRDGGSAPRLAWIRNERTAKATYYDENILDGEELEIDFTPGAKSVTSSFNGKRPGALLANSDVVEFALLPGSNTISTFIDGGSPDVTAFIRWRDQFKGFD
jgi:hypothetical protein